MPLPDPTAVTLRLGPAGTDPTAVRLVMDYAGEAPWEPPLMVRFDFPFPNGEYADVDSRLPLHRSLRHSVETALPAPIGAQLPADIRLPWPTSTRFADTTDLPWDSGGRLGNDSRMPWYGSVRLGAKLQLPWTDGSAAFTDINLPWGVTHRRRTDSRLSWLAGDIARRPFDFRLIEGSAYQYPFLIPLHEGVALRWLEWPEPDPEPPSPQPPFGVLGNVVVLRMGPERLPDPDAVILQMGEEITGSLIFMNALNVVTWPECLPVQVSGVSFSTDRKSWGHNLSMTVLDAASLDRIRAVNGTYKDVKVTVNGYERVFTVLRWRRTRGAGGRTEWVADGAGQICRLTADFAGTLTGVQENSRTHLQLMEEALDGTGWSLDVTDYPDGVVPGGIHSYSDQSPLALVMDLASAAGWSVRGHATARTIQVRPLYPLAPWELAAATPDVSIPDGAWVQIEEQSTGGVEYTRVHVLGDRQGGIHYQGTRDGTDGSRLAPDVVDRYITQPEIGYARARAELASRVPIQPGSARIVLPPGGSVQLIQLGDVIEIGGVKALATAVRVDAQRSAGGALTVWQYVSWGADQNPYTRFTGLSPMAPRTVATVSAVHTGGLYTITQPGGGTTRARGAEGWQEGDSVYVEGTTILSGAPSLPFYSGNI